MALDESVWRVNGGQRCPCGCHTDFSWLVFDPTNPYFNFANIDGLFYVERNNHFLVVEWKWAGESLAPASLQALRGLARLWKHFTVIVVHGPKGEPMQFQYVKSWGLDPRITMTDREDFQSRMRKWYTRVSASRPDILS